MSSTPISPEVLKQAREDYHTTRDAIVDTVNEKIGEIEQRAQWELGQLAQALLMENSLKRREFSEQKISAGQYRESLERLQREGNDRRGDIIELRMKQLGDVNRIAQGALDDAKAVYRAVVGAPFTA